MCSWSKPLATPRLTRLPRLCASYYTRAGSSRPTPEALCRPSRSAPGPKARAIEVAEGATSLAETTVASSADTAALAVTSSELLQGCSAVLSFGM